MTKDEREALRHVATSVSLLAEEAGKVAAFMGTLEAEIAALAARPIAPGMTMMEHLKEIAAEGEAIEARMRAAQTRYAELVAVVARSPVTGRQ